MYVSIGKTRKTRTVNKILFTKNSLSMIVIVVDVYEIEEDERNFNFSSKKVYLLNFKLKFIR